MDREEWRRLVLALGKQDPFVKAGLNVAFHNSELAPSIADHFRIEALKRKYDLVNMTVYPPPRNGPAIPDGGILLGSILDGERIFAPLRAPQSIFDVSTGVFGMSGVGKSTLLKCGIIPQLIQSGIRVLVFDREDEYAPVLCPMFPSEVLLPLKPEEFKVNPIPPPGGMTAEDWRMRLTNLCRSNLDMGDGMENLLLDILAFVHVNYSQPTIFHVWERMNSLRFKPTERHYGYLESLQNRFRTIMATFGEGKSFDCAEGFVKRDVLTRSFIIREHGLHTSMANLFEDLNLERLRWAQGESSELKTVVVFEEAHLKFPPDFQRRRTTENSERTSLTHIRVLRKRGIGLIWVDQVPSLLPSQLISNLGSVFVFRLVNPNCIRRIGEPIGLTPEQMEEIPALPNRSFVFFSHLC